MSLLSQGCAPLANIVAGTPTPAPSPLTQDTGRLNQADGRELWVNGAPFAADVVTTPLSYTEGGAIGRAGTVTTALGFDNRFRGDIAEVLVYDAAVTDSDRVAVEQYLRGHWRY